MKCGEVANVEVVWAMKRVNMCERHAASAGKLAEAMGWPFEPRILLLSTNKCESELGAAEIAERKERAK